MVVIQWILDNWDLIGVVLTIVFGAVEVVRATGNLRQGLLSLMLQAEKASAKGELGGITGPAIMDQVVRLAMERLAPRLPLYARPFVTEARVRVAAEFVYKQAKRYLQDGKLLPGAGGGGAPPQQ